MKKVLVVGTGWYGCQVARKLQELGVDFDMVDRTNDFFAESSSKNQNRLHFGGFHYSRSHGTRVECRRGYDKFVEEYPEFSRQVDSYYLVARESLLDFNTYVAIFKHENSPFTVQTLDTLTSRGIRFCPSVVDGNSVLLVKERWIDFERVRKHFKNIFGHKLKSFSKNLLKVSPDFEDVVFDGVRYDLMFDATYGKMFPLDDCVFEFCLTLIYKRKTESEKNSPSVTVVDGDFFSLYPYNMSHNLFTLTHVSYTPMFSSHLLAEVETFAKEVETTGKLVSERKNLIENDVCKWCPNFLQTHQFFDFFTSTKTKFTDVRCADRSMRECRRGNVVSVCGGKITGAFDVGNVVADNIGGLDDQDKNISK